MNSSSIKISSKKKTLWWKSSPKNKADKTSYNEDIGHLLKNASMHCYDKLVEPNRMFIEKFMWFVIHITMMGLLCFALNTTLRKLEESPLITSLHDTLYPIQEVAFPEISICSNNRISKQAANTYAKRLASVHPLGRDDTFFLRMIAKLGNLYTNDNKLDNETKEFQEFLNKYAKDGLSFNPSEVMFNLTPKCQDLLTNCSIGGKKFDCVSPNGFNVELTHNGYCCVFKMKGGYNEVKDHLPVGPSLGLVVDLNTSRKDGFFHLLNVDGFMVNIYQNNDYSDPASGGVKQRFIENGMEAYIRVIPQMFKSDMRIRRYAPSARNCLFADESRKLFGVRYTLNTCITQCRVKSIAVLCKCIPFYMPNYFWNATVYCNLNHLECLNRYKFKFSTVLMVREELSGLETEFEDALFCPECLPRCSYVQYEVSKMDLPIAGKNATTKLFVTSEEFARVRIYFYHYSTWLYLQTVRYPWFEILSNIGGLCGIFTGFSFAALFEIVYFLSNYLFLRLKAGFAADKKNNQTKIIIYP